MIINFNSNERFDFAMIIQYKDPENGEERTRWEKLYYSPQEKLPRVPQFKEED
jgi:hypothetical protein